MTKDHYKFALIVILLFCFLYGITQVVVHKVNYPKVKKTRLDF